MGFCEKLLLLKKSTNARRIQKLSQSKSTNTSPLFRDSQNIRPLLISGIQPDLNCRIFGRILKKPDIRLFGGFILKNSEVLPNIYFKMMILEDY
jgi:hypothetical protein